MAGLYCTLLLSSRFRSCNSRAFRCAPVARGNGTRVALWSVVATQRRDNQREQNTMSKHLGKAEQAIYERLRMGALNAGEAAFFSRQIGALVSAKIARRTPEGGAELVNPTQYATQPPPARDSQPPGPSQSGTMPAALPTITARVPVEVIAYLDSLGLESRGAAVRHVFAEYLASIRPGVRKTVGR